VLCERVFSSGKETMTPRRNRISAELMEALQLLKFSFKKGRELNFTVGVSEEDEIKEMEAVAESAIPEDM
jgi:hypothetical protein